MGSSVVQLDMHCCEICVMSMNRIMPILCEHCLSGAGIYVDEARTISHAGRQAAQPNNTYIVVDTGPNEFSNFVRVRLHCCSNATSSNAGSITFPNGVTWTANYESFRITRYNAGTANAGCIIMDIYYRQEIQNCYNSPHWPYQPRCDPSYRDFVLKNSRRGIYTCNIPDINGNTQKVNFALYPEGSKFAQQQLSIFKS